MNLLIDAGNTRIKWALTDGMTRCAQASGARMPSPRLLPQSAGSAITSDLASVVDSPSRMASGSISNVSEADECNWLDSGNLPVEQADELAQFFAGCFDRLGVDSQNIQIWASNVAGEEVAQHIRNIGTGQQPEFIVAREMQCGVRNNYSSASQLGSDRWAALVAAWHLVRGECLVVCCGTATTVDTLSSHGEFLGGLILPGVELMQRSLCGATARLQPAQGKYAPFPLNTADALLSGAIQASCGAIERQHALPGNNAPVLLSGGAAAQLQAHLRHVTGEASRLREEVRCGHSRTGELRSTVSWPHIINLPVQIVDNLVLQGLLLIAQEAGA